jgi:catechol 2,3-dioxygenase
MAKFTIHPATTVGTVTLTVANLEAMVKFYCNSIGLQVRDRLENKAILGTTKEDILVLIGDPKAKEVLGRTGLYHFAILLPSRPDLAHWLKHFLELAYRPPGVADHVVSEALYLSDPEGNGIKIYRDRPRERWPFVGDKLTIVANPLNLDDLLAAAPDTPWIGISDSATLGHIHLSVHDLHKSAEFYVDLLGFELMQDEHPGALFVSAGGYHHHLGANIWHSAGASPPPSGSLGLQAYTIQLPNERERSRLVERLETAQYPIENAAGDPLLRDPAGNALILTVA